MVAQIVKKVAQILGSRGPSDLEPLSNPVLSELVIMTGASTSSNYPDWFISYPSMVLIGEGKWCSEMADIVRGCRATPLVAFPILNHEVCQNQFAYLSNLLGELLNGRLCRSTGEDTRDFIANKVSTYTNDALTSCVTICQ